MWPIHNKRMVCYEMYKAKLTTIKYYLKRSVFVLDGIFNYTSYEYSYKKLMIQVLLLRILITYGQGHSIEYIMTYKPSLENNKNFSVIFLDILNNESLFRSEKSRDSDSIQNKTGYSGSGSTILMIIST